MQDNAGGVLQKTDGGAGDGHEEKHGGGDGDGQIFRSAQGEGFGNELPEENVEVSYERKAEDDGGNVGVDDGVGQTLHPIQEDCGGYGFADPTKGQGAEGDAELDCRKETVEVALEAADGGGAGNAGGDHLFDAGVAHGDQRKLRGDEKAVGQNEQGDGNDLEQEQAVHGVRFVLDSMLVQG